MSNPRKKKGPTKGSGGQGRRRLEGKGPTPKAEDRTWHKNYKPKKKRPTKAPKTKHDAVAGRNPVVEALRTEIPATGLYVATGVTMDERIREALKLAADRGLPVLEATMPELDRMTRDAKHQGIALHIPPYEYQDATELGLQLMADWNRGYRQEPPLIVALDSITDPRNLGAMVRSAAAFGVDTVVVPARRSVGMTATAWKTSAGAAARLPVSQVVNLPTMLVEYQKAGMFVIGLDGHGNQTLPGLPLATEPLCVVVGSEGKGLSRLVADTCDQIVSIPIVESTESLNASVAVGVSLYEISRQRNGRA